jgi:hypothetical protein
MLALLLAVSGSVYAADANENDSTAVGDAGTAITGDAPSTVTVDGNTVTAAGSTVVNDALLDYQVGGVQQETLDVESDPDSRSTFVVDRRIDVNVTRASGAAVDGTPGGSAFLHFSVTNQTNDDDTSIFLHARRIALDLDDLQTDRVLATPVPSVQQICIDGNADQRCDDTSDTVLSTSSATAEIEVADNAPDEILAVIVEVSVPIGAEIDEWDSFLLAAAIGVGGTRVSNDDNNNVSPDGTANDIADDADTVESVFADADFQFNSTSYGIDFSDGSVADDLANDGQNTAADQFQVAAAVMTVTKTSEVVYDPVNGEGYTFASVSGLINAVDISGTANGNNPKRIPGAIVRYRITAQNDAGDAFDAADAEGVSVTDTFPSELAAGDSNVAVDAGLNYAVVTDCAGNSTEVLITGETDIAASLSTCTDDGSGPGQSGTVVYFMTIP